MIIERATDAGGTEDAIDAVGRNCISGNGGRCGVLDDFGGKRLNLHCLNVRKDTFRPVSQGRRGIWPVSTSYR